MRNTHNFTTVLIPYIKARQYNNDIHDRLLQNEYIKTDAWFYTAEAMQIANDTTIRGHSLFSGSDSMQLNVPIQDHTFYPALFK